MCVSINLYLQRVSTQHLKKVPACITGTRSHPASPHLQHWTWWALPFASPLITFTSQQWWHTYNDLHIGITAASSTDCSCPSVTDQTAALSMSYSKLMSSEPRYIERLSPQYLYWPIFGTIYFLTFFLNRNSFSLWNPPGINFLNANCHWS